MIYYEIRSAVVRNSRPVMVTSEDVHGRTGFVSVYGFDQETTNEIQENGGTYGLRGSVLFSDCLYIDIDDNDKLAEEIEKDLDDKDVAYKLYHTGGRGWHFHICIDTMEGVDVAYKQKRWVEYNYPGADLSIYKTSGIIRMPNTYHYKYPGRYKKLVKEKGGIYMKIDTSELPPTEVTWDGYTEDFNPEAILDILWFRPVHEGQRNNAIFKRAFLCKSAGFDENIAIELIEQYNNLLVSPPVSLNELIRTVKSAYRK